MLYEVITVVVHCREAEADVAHMIREHKGAVRGVLHCFSGGAELLQVGLDAGWYVSFAGIVSVRLRLRRRKAREQATAAPK